MPVFTLSLYRDPETKNLDDLRDSIKTESISSFYFLTEPDPFDVFKSFLSTSLSRPSAEVVWRTSIIIYFQVRVLFWLENIVLGFLRFWVHPDTYLLLIWLFFFSYRPFN